MDKSGKRIARNTIMLYSRMFVGLLISLYTGREVLAQLGGENYGLYMVVFSTVTLLAFVNEALGTSTSRFLNYAKGIGDLDELKKVFRTAFWGHLMAVLLIALLLETVGIWWCNHKLVVPAEQLPQIRIIYQILLLFTISDMLSLPFRTTIFVHEKMNVFALISIGDMCAKLAIVLLLSLFREKLVAYALMLAIEAFFVLSIYVGYCRRNFPECRFGGQFDKKLFIRLTTFSSWNFLGSMAVSLKGNGINIVMNMFFAATLNAAFGIALHVQSSLNGFVQNFTNAAIPQLIQSYAAGETAYMEKLLLFSSKVAFFLLLLAAFPVIFDADFLLALWLKQVPPFTSIFVRLMLIDALINTPIYALGALAQATGTIALYQVVVSGIILLNVPLTYLVFKFGGLPQTAIAVAILLSLLALLGRLLILKKLIPGFPLRDFLCSFLFRAVLAAGFAALPPLICLWFMSPGWIRFAVSSTTCVGTTVGMILLIGFNRQERGDVCRIVREAVYKRLMWN